MELLNETARGLYDTFVSRRDMFAMQLDDGRYFASNRNLTTQHIEGHLQGNISLGIYLLDQDNTVKFAVIDADDEEGRNKLLHVHQALEIPSYLESSRRGGHLWFFFDQPVEGKIGKTLVWRLLRDIA